MISDPRFVNGTDESTLVMDSSVPLMYHDLDRSWITDPDPDHPKGAHSKVILESVHPWRFCFALLTSALHAIKLCC